MYIDRETQRAEDQQFLSDAVRQGRINEKDRDIWASAMVSDRTGTRNVISSMPSAADNTAEDTAYKSWNF